MSEAKLTKILDSPPKKYAYCSWCGGTGITDRIGMVQSKTCSRCHGDKKGKLIIDYVKWRKQIRDCVKAEIALKGGEK